MPDQYKQYSSPDREPSLETSPPTTPTTPTSLTSHIQELENQPPVPMAIPIPKPISIQMPVSVSPALSPSLSRTLSSSASVSPMASVANGVNGVNGKCGPIHRKSQLAMKVKQEVLESNDNYKYQSRDCFSCDTNNNSNKNISNHTINNNSNHINSDNSNASHKTTIAKQILSVIRNDDFEELLIILRSKPDLNVFVNGQTALHYCLLLGRDVSWCRQLVLNGANPNLSNHDGWHPLHLAASFGHNEILSYLINCNTNKGMATTDVI